jgi:D-alanine-D-alanine ligase
VTIAHHESEIAYGLHSVRDQHDVALIEEYFSGRELTVTVVNSNAYPVIEIRPKDGFYDYQNKYTAGRTDYLCPAPITAAETAALQLAAVRAFNSLGCAGVARVDFLLNDQSQHICLEVNSLPGMTATSLVPKAALAHGETPEQLMQKIIDAALATCAQAAANSDPAF